MHQLQKMLSDKGHRLSLTTRRALRLTYRGSAYCEMIRDVNKAKCVTWAKDHLNDSFEGVFCSTRNSDSSVAERKDTLQRTKHLVKVHIWAEKSKRGRTAICVFKGIMEQLYLYIHILDKTLLPIIRSHYPD